MVEGYGIDTSVVVNVVRQVLGEEHLVGVAQGGNVSGGDRECSEVSRFAKTSDVFQFRQLFILRLIS